MPYGDTMPRVATPANWTGVPRARRMDVMLRCAESKGLALAGENIKFQSSRILDGVTMNRVFHQAQKDGRCDEETGTMDFNDLLVALIDAYANGKVTLPVGEEASETEDSSAE